MIPTIKIQKTPSSGPGQSLKLTGYSSQAKIYLIQYILHHDLLIFDIDPYFSGCLVWVTETNVVTDQKSKVVDFFVYF